MKIRAFLPVFVLSVVFVLFLAAPAFAQEDVTPAQEEEVVPEQEEVIEEEIIEEEIIEEEVIEEEIFLEEEEEVIEEEVVEEVVEEIVEEPSLIQPDWGYKAYVNIGFIEPAGDPGTGEQFGWHPSGETHGTGLKFKVGAQINPDMFLSLPAVLDPLSFEALLGYSMYTSYVENNDDKTTIMSLSLCGRYDLTDLIMQWIGFEYPALGIFGVAGFQFNMQSWDLPTTHPVGVDSKIAFGTNFAIGAKYNLMSAIGKPVEIDLRGTWNPFIMGDVEDKDGVRIANKEGDYKHYEMGFLLGIAYPF